MKIKKYSLLTLILIAAISIVACTANDTGTNTRNRNLSTQVRPNNRLNVGRNMRNANDLNPNNNFNGMRNNDMVNDNMRDGNMGFDDPINNNARNNNLNDLNRRNNGRIGNNIPNNNLDTNLNDGMTRPNNNPRNNSRNSTGDAQDIAKRITDLPEVDKARVILTGDTALIGCRLRGNTQGTMTNSLRQQIENIVKDRTDVQNVSITTEPELFSRIETMANDVRSGNPVEDFADDIRDLIRRITPRTNNNKVPR